MNNKTPLIAITITAVIVVQQFLSIPWFKEHAPLEHESVQVTYPNDGHLEYVASIQDTRTKIQTLEGHVHGTSGTYVLDYSNYEGYVLISEPLIITTDGNSMEMYYNGLRYDIDSIDYEDGLMIVDGQYHIEIPWGYAVILGQKTAMAIYDVGGSDKHDASSRLIMLASDEESRAYGTSMGTATEYYTSSREAVISVHGRSFTAIGELDLTLNPDGTYSVSGGTIKSI